MARLALLLALMLAPARAAAPASVEQVNPSSGSVDDDPRSVLRPEGGDGTLAVDEALRPPASCEIDLRCEECLPEHMPLVTSPRAAGGRVAVAAGAELHLSCGAGRLLAAPAGAAVALCEAGRWRLRRDGSLRHLLDLGCRESIFEDALHPVQHCSSPLRGRVYLRTASEGAPAHLAALCYDEDRGAAAFAHKSNAADDALRPPPHADRAAPPSLLGNFHHVFDADTRAAAERLFSDDARTNRRLREMLKYDRVALAEQTLTSGKLLSGLYFDERNARAAEFPSNKVPVWSSVARGNLRHLQRDTARLLRRARPRGALHVYAGALGVAAVRTGGANGTLAPLYLRGERFPVPKYIWTVLHDSARRRALAVVLLNDPFVAVSEVRATVFCESRCARAPWLSELLHARRYETPVYGLAFCCAVHDFLAPVEEMPREILASVPRGDEGLLTDFTT